MPIQSAAPIGNDDRTADIHLIPDDIPGGDDMPAFDALDSGGSSASRPGAGRDDDGVRFLRFDQRAGHLRFGADLGAAKLHFAGW